MPERGRLRLGDLAAGRAVSGIVTDSEVTVVAVRMFGPKAAQVTYRRPDGTVEERILYEEDAERLAEVNPGTAGGGFEADPGLFRLAAEALRIRMAARGDAMLAVSTSLLDPLPHQIQAVYNELLPRTPLRFLLADDPGENRHEQQKNDPLVGHGRQYPGRRRPWSRRHSAFEHPQRSAARGHATSAAPERQRSRSQRVVAWRLAGPQGARRAGVWPCRPHRSRAHETG